MQRQRHHNILIAIGATKINIMCQDEKWELIACEYSIPTGPVQAYYLYLKNKCGLAEASRENIRTWTNQSKGQGYHLIVPPSSSFLSKQDDTINLFHGISLCSTLSLLQRNVVEALPWTPVNFDEEDLFISPRLLLESEVVEVDGAAFLASWLTGRKSGVKKSNVAVLIGEAGVGKTTISKFLCDKAKRQYRDVFPLLIEADQWAHVHSSISMNSLWQNAIERRFGSPGRIIQGKKLSVLLREGLLVVVFDGFDELCSSPYCDFSPKEILRDLVTLCEDEESNARILLTARDTFWAGFSEEIEKDESLSRRVEIFSLKAFNNVQRKEFFSKRLSSQSERDLAFRLSKQISGGIYNTAYHEELQEDRPSGVPVILALISKYVEDNVSDVNPYEADPFEGILKGICRRESIRQSLDIPPEQQFEIFEELFREHNDTFALEDLELVTEIITGRMDYSTLRGLSNHAFLSRIKQEKNKFIPKFEVLRIYFLARFLANSLLSTKTPASHRSAIAKLLAESSTGKTQVMEWLCKQLSRLEEERLRSAISHALDIIAHRDNSEFQLNSSLALFHLINMLISQSSVDKERKTLLLVQYLQSRYSQEERKLHRVIMTGSLNRYDFSGLTFANCTFLDIEFKNCTFSETTHFIDCTFDGSLSFDNCLRVSEIVVQGCRLSSLAEHSLESIRKKAVRLEIRQSLAEEVMLRALKKFKGDFGFASIRYSIRNSGFRNGNPYNQIVWKVLEKNKIVERNNISNVDEGGLHIVDNSDIKKEIMQYLNNAMLGPILQRALNEIMDK
jgi:hypothetical protein